MTRKTIVKGGNQVFQLSVSMFGWLMTGQVNGRALRFLLWTLWDAHAREVWPQFGEEPVDRIVRLARRDFCAGAGLDGDNEFVGLRTALKELADFEPGSLPTLLKERPGPYFDVLLHRALAEENWRPLEHYALLDMDLIRRLREPLDFALYACACLVARAAPPVRDHARRDRPDRRVAAGELGHVAKTIHRGLRADRTDHRRAPADPRLVRRRPVRPTNGSSRR